MRLKLNGEEIRRRREKQRLTQEKLAEAAELNVRTIRRAEGGKPIAARTLERIAHGLGAQAEALVFVERAVEAPLRSERSTGEFPPAYGLPSASTEIIPSWVNLKHLLGLDLAEGAYRLHMDPLRHIQELYANLPGMREAQLLAERAAEPAIRMQKEYEALVAPLFEEQRRLVELCSVSNPIGNVRLV